MKIELDFTKIVHSGAFTSLDLKNFFNHGENLNEILPKSFNLVRFGSLKLKNFFNHDENLNLILPKSFFLLRFRSLKLKNFFFRGIVLFIGAI